MALSNAERQVKLEKLADIEGFETVQHLLEAAVLDSICPGICIICDYTTEVEPDQREGYCESCGGGTVVSGLILAGLV